MLGSMLKIGIMGFGGGTALIPVIENETVNRTGIVTEEQFNKYVMLASITPGALPVELAAGIGYETAGNGGMVAAATALALPGSFLTLFLLVLFSGISQGARTVIGYLSALVSVLIICILFRYVTGTIRQGKSRNERFLYLLIVLAVFVLSGEKTIYALLGLMVTPVFSVSAIQILGTAFFVIFFTKGFLRDIKRTIPALVLSVAYFVCAGEAHLLPHSMKPYLTALMMLLAAIGLVQSVLENPPKKNFPLKEASGSVLSWILFTAVLSVPAVLLSLRTLSVLGAGFLSSVMSFGGGDAYLSVANGLFVESGLISSSDFYGNIVTVANALPGSILCKTFTGVGYCIGYGLNQSIWEGILMAVSCFACSVAASGLILMLVRGICEKYEKLRIFAVVKHFIRPIISGLLINVAFSLYLSGILPCITALFL